jgi:hypothetical protein
MIEWQQAQGYLHVSQSSTLFCRYACEANDGDAAKVTAMRAASVLQAHSDHTSSKAIQAHFTLAHCDALFCRKDAVNLSSGVPLNPAAGVA